MYTFVSSCVVEKELQSKKKKKKKSRKKLEYWHSLVFFERKGKLWRYSPSFTAMPQTCDDSFGRSRESCIAKCLGACGCGGKDEKYGGGGIGISKSDDGYFLSVLANLPPPTLLPARCRISSGGNWLSDPCRMFSKMDHFVLLWELKICSIVLLYILYSYHINEKKNKVCIWPKPSTPLRL